MRSVLLAGLIGVSVLAQTPEMAVGLVRPDGIMVPLAVFESGKWLDAWPDPGDRIALDRMIEATPSYWRDRRRQIPQVWHVTDHPSHKPVPIRVLTRVIFEEHCETQVGVLTDLRHTDNDAHDRKLTMSWPGTVEWPVDALAAGVNRAPWLPLMTAATRSLSPRKAVITTAQGFLEGNHRILYYEAEKAPGDGVTFRASGWVVAAGESAPRLFESRVADAVAGFEGYASMKPIGIIRVRGASLWVVHEHYYEGDGVSLVTIDGSGFHRAFTKRLGGC
jgi:hypothetical protein